MSHYWTWDGSPELLRIGAFSIRWYGAFFALGFYLGLRVLNRLAKMDRLEPPQFDSMLTPVIAGTVIGARLGHVFFYEPSVFLEDPIRILKVWEGGLASHGGTLGVALAVYLWKRKHYAGTLLSLLDRLAVPSAMVAGMIRLGNFFNSEILGRASDLPWAIVFKRVDEVPRHPAMLYEALSYFGIFAVLMGVVNRGVHRRFGDGFLLGIFFMSLFTARFLIEFCKEIQVPSEAGLPLDLGQILSLPFVIMGGFLVVRSVRKRSGVSKASS